MSKETLDPEHGAWHRGYVQACRDIESGVLKVATPPNSERRFQAAVAAMQAIIAKTDFKVFEHDKTVDADIYTARGAVRYADALLAALDGGAK